MSVKGTSDIFVKTSPERLQLEPRNSDALRIRAIAKSQLNAFREAIQDAAAAIALLVWREAAQN